MEKGQLVRLTQEVAGVPLAKDSICFVIERASDKIAIMGIDEEGVILGAGIVEESVLEPVEDDVWSSAKEKYDTRLNATERAAEQGRLNMIRTVADDTGLEVELVTKVIDAWDRLRHNIASNLR